MKRRSFLLAPTPICHAAMLPSPVTSTPFSVKDILKLEQQHALNPTGFMGVEQDTVPLQSLQLQCMQSTLSRSLDLLYSPEKHSLVAGEQVKCALHSDDFDIVRSSCGSPTEEEMDPSEETSRICIVILLFNHCKVKGLFLNTLR